MGQSESRSSGSVNKDGWTNKVFVKAALSSKQHSLPLPLTNSTWSSYPEAIFPSEDCDRVYALRLYEESLILRGAPAELSDTLHAFLVVRTNGYWVTMEKCAKGIQISYHDTLLYDFDGNRRESTKMTYSHRTDMDNLYLVDVLAFALRDCDDTLAPYDVIEHNCRQFAHTIYRRFVPGPADGYERFIYMSRAGQSTPSVFEEVLPNWIIYGVAPVVTAPVRLPMQAGVALCVSLFPNVEKPWFMN